jgi:hypothetical protein
LERLTEQLLVTETVDGSAVSEALAAERVAETATLNGHKG